MIVTTILGQRVSLVHTDRKFLYERDGSMWCRDSVKDTQDRAAYTKYVDIPQTILLDRHELKRICAGDQAMIRPTTVEGMRDYATGLEKDWRDEVSNWPDQRLREILADAEEQDKDPGRMLEKMLEKLLEPVVAPTIPTEATERPTEAPKKTPRYSNTPRPRKQEGSVSVALEGVSVLLTPKQLEFMERLSENEGWAKHGIGGEYSVNSYSMELSDSMSAMSVGAVVTTLREKHLLQTTKVRVAGLKSCIFQLTDLGKQVYLKLSGGKQ